MRIIDNIKYIKESNKLLKLNKPIELMNDNELKIEISKRFEEINKSKKIDDRSDQIIKSLLNRQTREKNQKEQIIIIAFLATEFYELRQEILTRYSKYINERNINEFLREIENIEDKEINNTKNKNSNQIDELRQRRFIYEGIVYSENLSKIDVLKVLKNSTYETFEKIYEKVPKEQKDRLLIEIMKQDLYISRDERFEKLLINISENLIKEEILKGGYIDFSAEKFDRDNIEISVEDVKDFYKKYGTLNFKSTKILYQDDKIYSPNEILEELRYFKDDYNRQQFLNIYLNRIQKEQIEELIFDKNIDDEIRESVLNSYIKKLPDKDRLDIFKKLDEEMKSKTVNVFTDKFNRFYNKDEVDIDKHEYINIILSQISNEKTYNNYVIKFFQKRETDIEKEMVFKALLDEPQYLSEIGISIYKEILEFSDEQIRTLYEKASDEIKAKMIKLSRRKEYFFNDWEEETIEENEQNLSKYIIVNEENYAELIKNADILTLKEIISIKEYKNLLTKEQCIEIIQKLVKAKDITNIESYLYRLIPKVVEDASIKDIKNIILKFNSKEVNQCIFREIEELHVNIEELRNELLEIDDIQDKTIRYEYIFFLRMKYERGVENNRDESARNVQNILKELIEDENTSIQNKYLYLSHYFHMSARYNSNEISKEKAMELYKYINKLAGKEKYNEFLKHDNFIYRGELLPYFYDDRVYDILMKLYENNHNVINTISPALLDEKVLNEIDYELLEFYSRYYSDSSLKNIFADEYKVVAFVNSYKRLNLLKAYPEEDLLKVIEAIERSDTKELQEIDFSDEHNIDKLISIAQSSKYASIKNFESYEEQIKKETRNIINKPFSSRNQLLDAIGKRFFALSYEEMDDIVIKYSKDIKLFIDKYEDRDELTLEEQNELLALKTIRNLKEIINIKDKKAIIDTFNELDKDEAFEHIDFAGRIVLDENVRRVFAKDYLKDIYIPKETDKRIIDGVEVYSPKEFNMFVHVVGAYSDFKIVDEKNPEKSAVELWDNNENKQSHLMCTSYIRNSNMSYAKIEKQEKNIIEKIKAFFKGKKKDLILGFADIGLNTIQMSSTADIAVKTIGVGSQQAYRYYTYRSADNLSNCTRIMYNEVDIERRLEDNRINNIKPSYVICFDEVTKDSKKVANDFGIPIIYLDNREIAKQESEKLEKTFQKYKETKDSKLLKDMIVQYMNNTISFSFKRKDLIEKYFNEEKMSKRINEMITNLNKEYKFGNQDIAITGLSTLYNAFKDEIQNYEYGNIDPMLSNYSKFNIKQFAFDLKKCLKDIGVDEIKDNINAQNKEVNKSNSYQDSMLRKIKQIEGNDDYER